MATIPNPRTWVDGELVTSGLMNQEIRDGINNLMNLPACNISASTTKSYASGSFVRVNFDTVDYDNAGMAQIVDNLIRVPIAGLYQVVANFTFPRSTSGRRRDFKISTPNQGTSYAVSSSSANIDAPATFVTMNYVRLLAGGELVCYAFHDATTALVGGPQYGNPCNLAVRWVGE